MQRANLKDGWEITKLAKDDIRTTPSCLPTIIALTGK
jgi:hypothetical protein